LPQEDFCQVGGISPLKKYQNEGGPGITQIMKTLGGSTAADVDRFNFFKTQIIFWLLAAIDGHAKNYSVFLLPGARFKLTPAYDVLSAHPVLGSGPNQFSPFKVKLAMAVRGTHYHYKLMEVQTKHWVHHAAIVGLGDNVALSIIDEIVSGTKKVIDEVSRQIPDEFPHKMAEAIFAGMRAQCAKL
jgi:serine/threonine-protein kinase HipA